MIVLLPFAFLSGIVTILSPCILPVLPIVLSGGIGGRRRPFGVVVGFVVSFSVFTLILSAIVQALAIPPDALRIAAVVLIVGFGLVLLIPTLRDRFEILTSRIAAKGAGQGAGKGTGKGAGGPRESSGFAGGLIVGMSLGLVWTPCVGPIMASVISLAVTQSVDGGAVFIILAYSLGTSIPMLGVMFGGRALLKRVPVLSKSPAGVQRVFGVLMILVGMAIGFGWDRQFQSAVLTIFPGYGSGLTALENIEPVQDAIDARATENAPAMMMTGAAVVSFDTPPEKGKLGDYGAAPPIVTTGQWFNTDGPLTMDGLRGKVVLVDFWTYSCVNCVRTLPYLRSWHEAYADEGLVIVGVHSPEFAFERSPSNVKAAIEDLGVTWPVVLDNEFAQWTAYRNRYWPAHYFIDAAGQIRYFHFGEGEYDTSEAVIRQLLEEAGGVSAARAAATPEADNQSKTAETYLGYARSSGFVSETNLAPDRPTVYKPQGTPSNGEWNLDGEWTITREYAAAGEDGVLELGFYAKDVFLVIDPGDETEGRVEILVDGKAAGSTPDTSNGVLRPQMSRLYQLVALPKAGKHVLKLHVYGDLKLFAFTFG